jgi:mono/diheme cytochrome c family protein
MPRASIRTVLKWPVRAVSALAVLSVGLILLAYARADRKFEARVRPLNASTDTALIARGRYLVYGPGHCADCHAPPARKAEADAGRKTDLSGGYALKTFLGELIAPNITSDPATGIGGVSDSLLTRFFRHGIDHRGNVGLPVMQYADLSDRDLVAILSFLRTLDPVSNRVPPSRYNVLGKITKAFFLDPFEPAEDPPPAIEPGPTPEYGGYLANAVANCSGCHTARDMKTGEFTGPPFAGGLVFRNARDPRQIVVSPNLTPDPETGAIAGWTRERFLERMRRGNLREWSPMPWGPFGRMTDADLEAIRLYLDGLGPVHRLNLPPAE